MSRSTSLLALTAVCLASVGGTPARAQWSSTAAANLVIASRPGEQVQPKIAVTSDGGCYVSWFDNELGGYDVRLQRLDAAGVPQWGSNGLLLADLTFSSTQDYGIGVDTEGWGLVAYRDTRSGGIQIGANRVSPSGVPAWGTGLVLTNTSDFVGQEKIVGTSDGNIVVAWFQLNAVQVRKLSPEGTVLWSRSLQGPGGLSVAIGDLQASDAPGAEGQVVVSMIRQGSFSTPRHLYAQKLDADGNPLWGASPITIYNGGSLQFGNFPPFTSDGSGGALFAWYATTQQSFVQRVLADGTQQYPANGIAVATDPGRLRFDPAAILDPASGDIYCFWNERNSSQSQQALYGQRFVGSTRAWGDGGLVLVPIGANDIQSIRCLPRTGGATAMWVQGGPNGQQIFAAARNADASQAWGSNLTVSSTPSTKSRIDAEVISSGTILSVWQDGATGAADIQGQNIRSDGTLGVEAIPGDLNNDGEVNGADLSILLSAWGACPPKGDCPADLNDDGEVNGADLAILLSNWG